MQWKPRSWTLALTAMVTVTHLRGADHGPVFGLATPTNPKGGWSFDLAVNGRSGTAANLEALLSYGATQNLKLSVSGPIVFSAGPLSAFVRHRQHSHQRRFQRVRMAAIPEKRFCGQARGEHCRRSKRLVNRCF